MKYDIVIFFTTVLIVQTDLFLSVVEPLIDLLLLCVCVCVFSYVEDRLQIDYYLSLPLSVRSDPR